LTDSNGTHLAQATVAVDLAIYSSQITTDINSVAIPEPSTYAAILGVAALGFVALRGRRRMLATA
jgi:hypothetical protein